MEKELEFTTADLDDLKELDELDLSDVPSQYEYQVWLLGYDANQLANDYEYQIDWFDSFTEAKKCFDFFADVKNLKEVFTIPNDVKNLELRIEYVVTSDNYEVNEETLETTTFVL